MVLDADGDGWLDLYVANDQVPNKLWMNRGDGTFVDEALLAGAGVNEEGLPEASMGLVAADLDEDGDEDLFMTHLTRETNTYYRNDGTGLFEDGTRMTGLDLPSWTATGFGVGLADFDRDGNLDLFVANGAVKRIEELVDDGDPYPLAQANQLYRGLGAGRWEEVTTSAGPGLEQVLVSRGVARGDLDLDGDDDLVVSNNSGPAQLLLDESPSGSHWLAVLAQASPAGGPAFGSTLLLEGDSHRSLRRVGTDGSYASAGSPESLLGLGSAASPVTLRADWLRGGTTVWRDLPIDRRWVLVRSRQGTTP
ncbi:MAG: CRTAC1 family protein [Thermoanaerobaculia bacterium]